LIQTQSGSLEGANSRPSRTWRSTTASTSPCRYRPWDALYTATRHACSSTLHAHPPRSTFAGGLPQTAHGPSQKCFCPATDPSRCGCRERRSSTRLTPCGLSRLTTATRQTSTRKGNFAFSPPAYSYTRHTAQTGNPSTRSSSNASGQRS
jgi:hypothetical protein